MAVDTCKDYKSVHVYRKILHNFLTLKEFRIRSPDNDS